MTENYARTVELIGALVTALGLAYAYGRAKYGESFIRDGLRSAWRQLLRRPRDASVLTPAALAVTGTLTAAAEIAFQVKANTSIELQIAQLAEQQRKWQTRFAAIEQQLSMHKHEMALAREHAESVASQARAEAQADLKTFGEALDKVAALDLRWAIVGILINCAGVAMGYWT